jgi:Tfp pilus assembly protein PilF/CelD/BcsL family acetyltransferase involved in cellulose biosynthesis
MQIHVIDTMHDFERLRINWSLVYESDPDAQYFLSWTWLSQWFPMLKGSWFILAAKPAGSEHYVAFFPLRIRLRERKRGGFFNEIYMAGNYQADYTGFICMPEFDKHAIPALARYVSRSSWARINLENIRTTDERLRLFLDGFPHTRFAIKAEERINKRDNIDNCICPFAELPDDWDSYLNNCLSANTRQKIRRFLRQVEGSGEFRITHATADTVGRDLNILLQFWKIKWAPRKGDRATTIMQSNYEMLKRNSDVGGLFLPVLWKGDTPVGALASLVDHQKKAFLFYIAGRDESFNTPPPGLVLHAHSIHYAIQNGFRTYDFLRGNEAYKYSFGTQERRIVCTIVTTRNGRNTGDKLDARTIPDALERATELHRKRQFVRAEQGYRQIIQTDPQCADALYRLGQLKASTGSHGTAKRIFKSLVAIKPDSERAWLRLGHSLEARRRFTEAADAYRQVISRHPNLPIAHNKLGNALFRAGRYEEAIAAFEKAVSLQPGYLEAEVSWANTLHLLGRLPAEKRAHYAAMNAALGDKVRQAGSHVYAILCYRQALSLKDDLIEAHLGLAQAFQAQAEMGKAAQSYRKVIALNPQNSEALAFLAQFAPPPTISAMHADA